MSNSKEASERQNELRDLYCELQAIRSNHLDRDNPYTTEYANWVKKYNTVCEKIEQLESITD